MASTKHRRILITLALTLLMLTPMVSNNVHLDAPVTPVSSVNLAAPTISGPSTYEFENGSVGHVLTYTASDPEPDRYIVERDGEHYDSGLWEGGEVKVYLVWLYTQHLIDTLPKDFEFNVTVTNKDGEASSAFTTVHVIADVRAPIIAQPENITYEQGSFGNNIRWNITESNPDFYNVSRTSNDPTANFTVVESGDWDGSNLTINVDGLNESRWYFYTLFVNDTLGHNSTSSVNVTVVPDLTFPVVTSPDDVSFEFGDEGFEVVWHAYDSNPKNYTVTGLILFNDTSYGPPGGSHPWVNITVADWTFTDPKGQDIVVTLDGLHLGNYTLTLSVYDDYDRLTTDSVNVTVYPDVRAPIIVSTGDVTYEEGYTGYSIEWGAEESNPVTFNLTRGSEILANGTWSGENYTISVDRLPVGVYFYNMTYVDYFNQSASEVIRVEVTPDAHLPVISQVTVVQAMTALGMNNLTVQAYVWDLNNVTRIQVQWGVGDPEESGFQFDTKDMVPNVIDDFFTADLGQYVSGTVVWYRIVAEDNSSVANVHVTAWQNVTVAVQAYVGTPGALYAIVGVLGGLSLLVVLVMYFKTQRRGRR
ncbi:MAG: hypothetical protein ACP6KW_06100 [Candidatus Thorarchaeota archaeon]